MDTDQAIEMLREGANGVRRWNELLQKGGKPSSLVGTDLSNLQLTGVIFSGINLNNTIFYKSNLSNAHFIECQLENCNFEKAKLESSKFERCRFSKAKFKDCDLSNANLSGLRFHQNNFQRSCLIKANFSSASLSDSQFIEASLKSADLRNTEIHNCNFSRANLSKANLSDSALNKSELVRSLLSEAKLHATKFEGGSISYADLRKANFNHKTIFNAVETSNTQVDSYSLEFLKDYGGLSNGDRMKMIIHNDVARLRLSYSGFLSWVHLLALGIFVGPYLWFLIENWTVAQFNQINNESSISLGEALLRYIFNGGKDWQHGWHLHWSFATFLGGLLYNLLRATLLIKTKRLELYQESTGLPPAFSFEGSRWGMCFHLANILSGVILLTAVLHLFHFLQQRIPIVN